MPTTKQQQQLDKHSPQEQEQEQQQLDNPPQLENQQEQQLDNHSPQEQEQQQLDNHSPLQPHDQQQFDNQLLDQDPQFLLLNSSMEVCDLNIPSHKLFRSQTINGSSTPIQGMEISLLKK